MLDSPDQRIGNYRLLRLLGEGGFAKVYLGEHIYLGTRAAIKLLQTARTDDNNENFLLEARTIAHLVHPHIVRVLDFGIENRTPFLVMDYAPGGTIRALHPKNTRLPLDVVSSYLRQVADALQYAHQQKIVHRDVKPENILLGARQEVMLSDFGIALVVHTSVYQNTQDTTGTISYMAPEHIQGKPRFASDQYALGVVVYEWLCGTRPFHGSFTELCTQHLYAPPPSLHERVRALPSAVEQVVFTALAKDPGARYNNVGDFATAFEQACYETNTGRTKAVSPPYTTSSTGTLPVKSQQPTYKVAPTQDSAPFRTTILPPQRTLPPTVKVPTRQQTSEPYAVVYPPAPQARNKAPKQNRSPQLSSARQRGISRRGVLIGFVGLAGLGLAGFLAENYYHSQLNEAYTYSIPNSSVHISSVAWSPNSRQVAVTGSDTMVHIWNIGGWGAAAKAPAQPILSYNTGYSDLNGKPDSYSVAWSPDGKHIVSAIGSLVQMWDATKKGAALLAYQSSGPTRSATWSPNSKYVAAAEDQVHVWDASNGHDVFVYTKHTLFIRYAAWSPNGMRIASVSDDSTVQIWDAFSGNNVVTIEVGSGCPQLAWSPDSKNIVIAAGELIRMCNAVEGGDPTYLSSNDITATVSSVTWSPDGKHIAAGYSDKMVQVWQLDYTDQGTIRTNHGYDSIYAGSSSGAVEQVAWSPDGKYIASCGDDGGVHIWSIRPPL